jgi:hypothetical protein
VNSRVEGIGCDVVKKVKEGMWEEWLLHEKNGCAKKQHLPPSRVALLVRGGKSQNG